MTGQRFNTWMTLGSGTFDEVKPLPGDARKPGARISAQVEFHFIDADEALLFMQALRGGATPVVIREGHDKPTPAPTG